MKGHPIPIEIVGGVLLIVLGLTLSIAAYLLHDNKDSLSTVFAFGIFLIIAGSCITTYYIS